MNLHLWVTLLRRPLGSPSSAATFATSLPFDLAHAVGNVAVLPRASGRRSCARCSRYRHALRGPLAARAPAPAAARAVVALVAAPRSARPDGPEAAAARASVRYLASAQNDDGGWGGAPGQSLVPALHAAGRRSGSRPPGATRATSARRSAVAYIRDHARELDDLGELNRTILVLARRRPRAADRRPRPRAGRGPQPAPQRLVRRPRQHDRVRDPRPARGRPHAERPGDQARRRLDR